MFECEDDEQPVKGGAVQSSAELVGGGPDDGATVDIGVVEELASYVARHTRQAVHYYSLRRERGRWVYRWQCRMDRRLP